MTLKEINKVKTYDDLNALGIGTIDCDISHRGGGIGFYASDVANALDVDAEYLPRKFGAGCNYLGGGLRGSISASNFDGCITGRKAKLLSALAKACVRVYQSVEDDSGLNNDEYDDGDTNWDAVGTKASRKAGIISGY